MKKEEIKTIDFLEIQIVTNKLFIVCTKREFLFNQFKKYLKLFEVVEIIEEGKNLHDLHYIIVEINPYKKFDFDFHIQNFYDYLDTLHI